MIIFYSFFGLVSVLLLILFLYSDFFQDALNCTFTDTKLRPDGKPINMEHKLVGSKGSTRWKTIVYFDDTFEFTSKRTDIKNCVLGYKISLSENTKLLILKDAINAHQRAVRRIQKRKGNLDL